MTKPAIALAPGYSYRAPTEDDIPGIIAVMSAFDTSFLGHSDDYEPEDIREDWSHLNPATDAWVFMAPDGSMAGYGTETNMGYGNLQIDGYTRPNHRGRGVGASIITLGEARAATQIARQPEGARVVLYNSVLIEDTAAHALLEARGFSLARTHWRMGIELAEMAGMDAPPPAPEWPTDITMRTFVPGADERAVFDTIEESFQDHWGHTPRNYDEWLTRLERPTFDPSLWFLAVDGAAGEFAGVCTCWLRPAGGWVGTLAVRRPWRRHGLGLALLYQAFGEFYRRGVTSVGLGVDAQSLTGATRLYERAGMHPTMRIATFARELRPGVDLSVRELAQTEA
jgi:GNAT superfamily N-acetyltransferase